MVSTLMLGVPNQDCVGSKNYPIFFYAWHVLKAWCLHSMEKIKDSKVKCVVLDCLHMVMLMSINQNETIDDFKAHGKEMAVESFDNLHGVV
jgi:chromosomal replication initiation ATPase DnaA